MRLEKDESESAQRFNTGRMADDDAYKMFQAAVSHLAEQWLTTGLPSRQRLDEAACKLERLRRHLAVEGLWVVPPTMLTATLDDGLGQGLAVIERFAKAIGIRLISMGLMQTAAAIVDACRQYEPDYLGLTILQLDSEDDIVCISQSLSGKTQIVAGGPVFSGGPEFATRTGIHHSSKNVADFIQFMVAEAR